MDAISQSLPDLGGTVKGAEDGDRPDRRNGQGGGHVGSNARQPHDPDMKQLPGPLRRLEIRTGYLAEAQFQHVPVDRFADGVFCKVDGSCGAIEVGDLLTTSHTPGHAMKATDSQRAFGAVIGKALKSWSEGSGPIPILVALG